MSREGMIPEVFHGVNPRTLTPVANRIIVAAVIAVMTGLISINFLAEMPASAHLLAPRRRTRTLMMRGSVRVGIRCGLRGGRELRSTIPAPPPPSSGTAQRAAVVTETWNRSSARRNGRRSSTTQRANLNRPVSDSGALRWTTKTSSDRCVP
jgi:hypothetical protein